MPGDKFRQWKGAETMKAACEALPPRPPGPKCVDATNATNKVPCDLTGTDKFHRLEYLLAATMGSGGDEGRRKVELKELAESNDPAWATYLQALAKVCAGEKDCFAVSEKKPGCKCEVYESYRLGGTKGSPLALYIEYMQRAQVLAYLPSKVATKGGVFFVHGTVEKQHLWKIPPVT